MENLNSKSGTNIASAINKRITEVANEVFKKSPYDRTRTGVVLGVKNKYYKVRIDNIIYDKVPALKNIGTIVSGDTVICTIPNNQFSNIFIAGILDL